jgi:hypothetical protein
MEEFAKLLKTAAEMASGEFPHEIRDNRVIWREGQVSKGMADTRYEGLTNRKIMAGVVLSKLALGEQLWIRS